MIPVTESIAAAPPRRGRPPGKDTIQTRLAEPASTKIPIPVADMSIVFDDN